MTKTLTAANASLALAVTNLFTTPQAIQGFANDEAFSFEDVETSESVMGVDGILSFGWVPVPVVQSITLQANSDSNIFFEDWFAAQLQAGDVLGCSGTVIYPSVGRQYNLVNGVLRQYSPAPEAKKILQPRKYSIVWNYVEPSAYVGA